MRLRLLLILFGAAAVIGVYTFPFWRPLLVNTVVDEPFPGLPADLQDAFAALPASEQAAFLQMAQQDPQMAAAMAAAALQTPRVAEEGAPTPDAQIASELTSGDFTRIDTLHWAEGSASIYQLPNGSRFLRFEDFRAANGPDLHVILSAGEEPRSREEVERGGLNLDLGPLKGNIGSQNYEIPTEIDLSLYNSVVIYCLPFHVVFSTASI
jgi:hypothetical protein